MALSLEEVEMLAMLLQRCGVNAFEMVWANGILDRLKMEAGKAELEKMKDKDND